VTDLSGRIGLADVALALGLVVVAMIVSRWRRLDLEGDIGVATVRAFVQLMAVGFVLDYVFSGRGELTPVVLVFMVVAATSTAGRRGREIDGSYAIAAASLTLATAFTLGVIMAIGIVPAAPRAAIPLGSMILSTAMNATSLVMIRLRDDLAAHRREVEARLSLGQQAHEAAGPWHRSALRTGMLPIVDQTKVVGLVALPGAMTGMILAGASPIDAIRLQLVVMYMLLGGAACAAVVSGELSLRRLFTPDHQLVRSLRRSPS
jgi:putative ABC transport system permease protein